MVMNPRAKMGSRVVESLVNSGTLVGRGDRSQLLFDIFLDPPRPEISLDFAEDVTDNQSVSKSNVCVRKMYIKASRHECKIC